MHPNQFTRESDIDWLIDLLTMTSSENEFHKQKQVMQKK